MLAGAGRKHAVAVRGTNRVALLFAITLRLRRRRADAPQDPRYLHSLPFAVAARGWDATFVEGRRPALIFIVFDAHRLLLLRLLPVQRGCLLSVNLTHVIPHRPHVPPRSVKAWPPMFWSKAMTFTSSVGISPQIFPWSSQLQFLGRLSIQSLR